MHSYRMLSFFTPAIFKETITTRNPPVPEWGKIRLRFSYEIFTMP